MNSKSQFLSPCKVNLFLNVLGKRDDGFHDLESIFLKVEIHDGLSIEMTPQSEGIRFSCSDSRLPTDSSNLVVKAAVAFFEASSIRTGAVIHLDKKLPSEAGLGGGSGNAAITLAALNELHGSPLSREKLHELASGLGSDVPFFLMGNQAFGAGRGEILEDLPAFPCLSGRIMVIAKPDFGVPTGWAFRSLQEFGDHARRPPGEARKLADKLAASSTGDFPDAGDFFNSFEYPVFRKFPILEIIRNRCLEQGARMALLSGSGSAVFGIFDDQSQANQAMTNIRSDAGDNLWIQAVRLS